MTVPFERVKQLVAELAELPAAERTARLDQECRGEPELRAEVESLLAHVDAPLGVLDRPAHLGAGLDGDDAARALPGRIGHYRVVRRLAFGGMGAVYLAEQDHPRRTVAVKTLRRELLSESMLRRFRRESELLGRLQHRGIAQIFEAGTFDRGDGPEPFFAMEYVDGVAVTEYTRRHQLRVAARVALMVEICQAVHHAHQKGVVHRDLKPGNVLVDASGQPKILDFGVARAVDSELAMTTLRTEPGQLIGTLSYMSPEQVAGDPDAIDTRSDVYALGVLLFELLGDRLPLAVHGRSLPEAARVIREDAPTRLGSLQTTLRGDLETIVGKALEKEPERRYASADALAEDLRRHLAHAPIAARPPSTFYQLRKFASRNKALVLGAAATLLASIAGTVVASLYAMSSSRSEAQAQHALALANVTIADRSLETTPRTARRALDDVPAELRNWEWRYLDACLEPLGRLPLPPVSEADPARGSVAITSDGTALYAYAVGRSVAVRDLASGVESRSIEAPVPIRRVELAERGGRLAAITATAARVLVWNLADGELCLDQSVAGEVKDVALSADGRRIAIEAVGRVRVLDVDRGEVVLAPVPEGQASHKAPSLSPTGDLLAVHLDRPRAGGSCVEIWDCASGERRSQRRAGYIASTFSADGAWLAVATLGQELCVYDATTGDLRERFKSTERGRALAFSSAGARVATASAREIQVWDLAGHRTLVAFNAAAREVALSSDGAMLVAATADGGWLWQLERERSRVLVESGRRVLAVAFHPDGTMLASLSDDGCARLWDAASGALIAMAEVPARNPRGRFLGRGVQFSADGTLLLVVGGGLYTWDWVGGKGFVASSGDEDPRAPWIDYWSHCGARARRNHAVCDATRIYVPQGRQIAVYDRRTGEALPPLSQPEDSAATALALSPDGVLLASGYRGGVIRVWDRRTGAELRSVVAHDDLVYALDFSPEGTRLASGGLDFSVRLWDVATLEQVLELRGHQDSLRDVAFSPDGTQLASCGSDGTVRIWDTVPSYRRSALGARGR